MVKEILALRRSRFLCGDFRKFLPASGLFDVVFASGVLYHMTEPLQLLHDIAVTAPAAFLWTHYYDAAIAASNPAVLQHFGAVEQGESFGLQYQQARYEYASSVEWGGFCGGSATHSYWLPRETILTALKHFGFNRISIGFEATDHPHGPAFALVAMR